MPEWGPFSVNGQNAVVTGGALGIGRAIVTRLCEAGANVLIADIDEDAARQTASTIDGHEGRVGFVRADVTDPASCDAIVERCVSDFGSLDIFVNNAGIYPSRPTLDTDAEFFDRVYTLNVRGTALCAKAAVRQMIEQGSGGSIINLASIDGIHPTMPGLQAYDASKGAVIMLTKSLALEFGRHGIRINAIAPGGITTEGTSAMRVARGMTPEEAEESSGVAMQRLPLGRMGTPDDIGKVATFLASPAAGYMTGEVVVVDGGWLLM